MIIPAEITSKHGVKQEDAFRYGGSAEGITDAVYDFAVVGNDHLLTARHVFEKNYAGKVPREAMPLFLIGAPVSLFFDRLERSGFDVFSTTRVQVRDWRLAWRVWRTFHRGMF